MSFRYLKSARKIACIGRNYVDHVKELNNAIPKNPFFFLKPISSIITPTKANVVKREQGTSNTTFHGLNADGTNPSPIYIPKNVNVHHEIELALIMKANVSNVNPLRFSTKDLLESIQGVALALDLTGRNVQSDAKRSGLPWSIAKGYDTFCPMSEMVPLDKLPNVNSKDFQDSFRLKCFVNGELRQDGTSNLMLNSMAKIVSTISEAMSLEPNDIVLTGTPAGVGEIKPGDVIEGQLFYKNEKIVDMKFDCETKPGHYVYTSSV